MSSQRTNLLREVKLRYFFIFMLLIVLGLGLIAANQRQTYRMQVLSKGMLQISEFLGEARPISGSRDRDYLVTKETRANLDEAMLSVHATEKSFRNFERVRILLTSMILIGAVLGAFNSLNIPRLEELVERIRVSAHDMAQASSDISRVSDDHAAQSASQATAVLQLATTSEEIASASRSISQNAERVETIAESALKACQAGRKRIDRAVTEMDDLSGNVLEISRAMDKLVKTAGRIGDIAEIIDEISDQTNLLALNAAIEAAGAGEAGKRFAVVATEVRRLSERTVEATGQIADLVEATQHEVEQARELASARSREVRRGASDVKEVGTAFSSIVETVMETGVQVKEIRTATSQQTLATDQMARTVSEVQHQVDGVLHGAEDARRAAESLDEVARGLLDLLDRSSDEDDGDSDAAWQAEKYLALFRNEAVELIRRIGGVLLDMEGGEGDLGVLRQDLHTLKGSARLVGLQKVGEIVHSLETFVKDGTPCAAGEGPAVDLALEALDQIEGLAGLGKPEPAEGEVTELLARLEQGAQAAPPAPEEAAEEASSDSPAEAAAGAATPVGAPEAAAAPAPVTQQAKMAWNPSTDSVRVAVGALDELSTLSGELLLHQKRMAARFDQGRRVLQTIEAMRGAGYRDDPGMDELVTAMTGLTRQLEADMVDAGFLFEDVRARTSELRMQPFDTVIEPILRQLRSEARKAGKKLQVVTRGGFLPVDRAILEQLKPVLVHTLTNAVVHGLELPEARQEAGKDPEGTIHVSARSDGNRVQVTVEDDGRGLNPRFLRRAAVEKGLLTTQQADDLEDEDALQLIFTPGFSTAKAVSNVAGRGVGMDAVRTNVERLRGQIQIESEEGAFTRIRFLLPAAIGVVQALLVDVQGERLALPLGEVVETRRLQGDEEEGQLLLDDGPIPFVGLRRLLGWGEGPAGEEPWLVLLRHEGDTVGLRVDRVLREDELVLRHPGQILGALPMVAGATIHQDGRAGVILHPGAVTRRAREEALELGADLPSRPPRATSPPPEREAELPSSEPPADEAPVAPSGTSTGVASPESDAEAPAPPSWGEGKSILVVDDSDVSRGMLLDRLEAVGFEIREAADGDEGLESLEASPPDLLVTDYEMPRMDGLALVAAVREHPEHGRLPIVMVTSRAGDVADRARDLGVDALIGKDPGEIVRLLPVVASLVQPPA